MTSETQTVILQPETDREKNARYFASHAPLLLQQAAQLLEQRLQQEPRNGALWLRLGNTYRGLGKLQQASLAFQQAEKLKHEPALSRYLTDLCQQTPTTLIYPESTFTPAPFLRHFNLLNNAELESVWKTFNQHIIQFKDSGVGKNQIRKNTRDSVVLYGTQFKDLREHFIERITPILKQAFEMFAITPPVKQRYTVQMTSHTDGEFYRTHIDNGEHHAGVLSYVYYFNKSPKAFSGGELQLFDTNTTLNTAGTDMTSIEPLHNSLIVFPSNYYHQVCTVNLPKADRIWGRHTINGWLVDAANAN